MLNAVFVAGIVFFDELDSLCPKRSGDGTNANSERVVNQVCDLRASRDE